MKRMTGRAVALIAPLLLAPLMWSADPDNRAMGPETSDSLAQVEANARDARRDADTLKTFTRFPELYPVEAHKAKLTQIKTSVNDAAEMITKAHRNRAEIYPWQAELITRLLPKMDALSDDVDAAIEFVNSHPQALFRPSYSTRVEDIYDESNSVVRTVDAYLDWAHSMKEFPKETS